MKRPKWNDKKYSLARTHACARAHTHTHTHTHKHKHKHKTGFLWHIARKTEYRNLHYSCSIPNIGKNFIKKNKQQSIIVCKKQEIHCNLPGPSMWSLSFRFSHQNPVCISDFCIWFGICNSLWGINSFTDNILQKQ